MGISALFGSLAGLAVGAVSLANSDSDADDSDSLSPLLSGAIIGAVGASYVGIPLGVYVPSISEPGTNGSLGATSLGGLAGAGLSVGALYFLDSSNSGVLNVVLVGTAIAAPFVGSIVGYELSDTGRKSYWSMSAPAPTFGISPDGKAGSVGIGLQF